MGRPNPQNLNPVKTKEEARKRGRAGGIKSGIAKRKKKQITEMYAKMLAGKFNVNIKGKEVKMQGTQFLDYIVKAILIKSDSASVAMIKEIRQAVEGIDDPDNTKPENMIQINITTDAHKIIKKRRVENGE